VPENVELYAPVRNVLSIYVQWQTADDFPSQDLLKRKEVALLLH